jgi:hypothetical protein
LFKSIAPKINIEFLALGDKKFKAERVTEISFHLLRERH